MFPNSNVFIFNNKNLYFAISLLKKSLSYKKYFDSLVFKENKNSKILFDLNKTEERNLFEKEISCINNDNKPFIFTGNIYENLFINKNKKYKLQDIKKIINNLEKRNEHPKKVQFLILDLLTYFKEYNKYYEKFFKEKKGKINEINRI